MNRDDLLRKNSDPVGTNVVRNEEIIEDLEDFRNKSSSSVNGLRPIVRSYKVNDEQHLVKKNGQVHSVQNKTGHSENVLQESPQLHENARSSENIDRNVDYQGWLELKKRKWKDTLERRKRQRYAVLCYLHMKAWKFSMQIEIWYKMSSYGYRDFPSTTFILRTRVLHIIVYRMGCDL